MEIREREELEISLGKIALGFFSAYHLLLYEVKYKIKCICLCQLWADMWYMQL